MTQILVFGPSTTYGAWDSEGGWVQRLRKWLDEIVIKSNYEEYFLVYNLGIDGDTTNGILKRFDQEAKIRMWPDEETVIIFQLGGNDSIIDNKTGKTKSTLEEYKENTIKLFEKAKKYTQNIVCLGDIPFDESKTNPIPWLPTHSYKNESLMKFQDATKQICKDLNISFIDIWEDFEKIDYKKLLPDGVHPNDEGHEKVYKLVKDIIIKHKIITFQ
jgi:lysophospholipase L1-like esterase